MSNASSKLWPAQRTWLLRHLYGIPTTSHVFDSLMAADNRDEEFFENQRVLFSDGDADVFDLGYPLSLGLHAFIGIFMRLRLLHCDVF